MGVTELVGHWTTKNHPRSKSLIILHLHKNTDVETPSQPLLWMLYYALRGMCDSEMACNDGLYGIALKPETIADVGGQRGSLQEMEDVALIATCSLEGKSFLGETRCCHQISSLHRYHWRAA
jgi:hypothetical protein